MRMEKSVQVCEMATKVHASRNTPMIDNMMLCIWCVQRHAYMRMRVLVLSAPALCNSKQLQLDKMLVVSHDCIVHSCIWRDVDM